MIAILCGGRDHPPFDDQDLAWLEAVQEEREPLTLIIDGGARGADTHGRLWAQGQGIDTLTFWANWKKYDKSAGHLRNTVMLTYLRLQRQQTGVVIAVLAFPGGRGTTNMVSQARHGHVDVFLRHGYSRGQRNYDDSRSTTDDKNGPPFPPTHERGTKVQTH